MDNTKQTGLGSDNSHYVNLLHKVLRSLDNKIVAYKYASCKPGPIRLQRGAGRVPGAKFGVALSLAGFLSLAGHFFGVTNG